MRIKPTRDRVVIRPEAAETETDSGIALAKLDAPDKVIEGEVLAVGPGATDRHGNHRPMTVRQGDHVMFGRYSGEEIEIGEDKLLLMREADIVMILTSD